MKNLLFILLFTPLSIYGQNITFERNGDTLIVVVDSLPNWAKNYKCQIVKYESKEISFDDLPQAEPLSLQDVKNCISFPKESGLYKSLSGLCDVWFLQAKKNGASDLESVKITLDKLGEKILSLSR